MYRLVFFTPAAEPRLRIDPGPWSTKPRELLQWRDYYMRTFGYSPSQFRFQRQGPTGPVFVSEDELLSGRSGDSAGPDKDLLEALSSMA